MKKLMENLLEIWCNKLVDMQINDPHHIEFDGGIACPACGLIHGRCGDSMYPMMHMYSKTGDKKYFECAKKVFDWTMNNCLVRDGVIINDVGLNSWVGITVFTAMQLGEIFVHYSELPDSETYHKWYDAYVSQIKYVYDSPLFCINKADPHINPNVNYIFGKLAAMAGAYKVTGDEKYKTSAKEIAEFLRKYYFDKDGFIFGECNPSDKVSPKGYHGIDVGYNVEESLGALAIYLNIIDDNEMKDFALKSLRLHAGLMLPDGGWDNSWSVRNAKWSYWGSRTSDGCQVAYCYFSKDEPMFSEVAYRNLKLLGKCTHDGLLYGGPAYLENGYRACIHHTFCHAKSLCWVLDNNLAHYTKSLLPCETSAGIKEYKTAGIYVVNHGTVRATVTEYDFETVRFGHATGGTLSMLYEKTYGPVAVAGMTGYQMTEPSNMQAHRYGDGQMLTPRIEIRNNGNLFVSCNDMDSGIECVNDRKIIAHGRLTDIHHEKSDDYSVVYEFEDNEVRIEFYCSNPDAYLVFPVIVPIREKVLPYGNGFKFNNLTITSDVSTEHDVNDNRIFNLTPGFSAVALTYGFKNKYVNIKMKFDVC